MLHPQARALLDLIAERGLPPMQSLSPVEARLFYRDRRAITQPEAPPVAEVAELSAEGPHGAIPLRLYRPTRRSDDPAPTPVLVYFHGGGWTIGDLVTHDVLCRQFANASRCAIVSAVPICRVWAAVRSRPDGDSPSRRCKPTAGGSLGRRRCSRPVRSGATRAAATTTRMRLISNCCS